MLEAHPQAANPGEEASRGSGSPRAQSGGGALVSPHGATGVNPDDNAETRISR